MNKRSTTADFIKKSHLVHGDCYGYSKVSYVNNLSKVIIICKKHGEFFQSPSGHLSGKVGCKLCAAERVSELKSSNTNDFIKKSKKTHGDKYDYSKVSYINNSTDILIICKKHGEFYQKPCGHLRGHGCRLCKNEKLSKDRSFTAGDFIERSEKIHKGKYYYNDIKYVNAHTHVYIACPYHGVFKQSPMNHLKGKGCPKCAYSKLSQLFSHHTQTFIIAANKIHNNLYEYNLVTYTNARTKIKIVCKKHGIFEQSPNKHLAGEGCPHCTISFGEREIRDYLQKNNIEFVSEKIFPDCRCIRPLIFDFYLPELNIVIEFDGRQHFIPSDFTGKLTEEQKVKNLEGVKQRDQIKNDYCKFSKMALIRIPYTKIKSIPDILNKNLIHKEFKNASLCSD